MSRPLDPAEAEAFAAVLGWLRERATERGYLPPDLAGISLGGCAEAHRTTWTGAMRRSAHAHTDSRDPMAGWLCFKAHRIDVVVGPSGLPTVLARHEYAHLLAPSAGHGPGWQRAVSALGAPAQAKAYRQRTAARKARPRGVTVYYVQGVAATHEEYLAAERASRAARAAERSGS